MGSVARLDTGDCRYSVPPAGDGNTGTGPEALESGERDSGEIQPGPSIATQATVKYHNKLQFCPTMLVKLLNSARNILAQE